MLLKPIVLHISAVLVIISSLLFGTAVNAAESPWRLGDALGLNSGFSLKGEYQARFENLAGNVQPGTSPNDQIVLLRTTLDAQYNSDSFAVQFEIQDARQQIADQDTVLRDVQVSTLDVLQANIAYKFGTENRTQVQLGRFTDDWGSRRLMARNRYRNSINTFDGLLLNHQQANGNQFKFMSTQIVRRYPRDKPSLLDNDHESDESSEAQRFHGIFAELPNLSNRFNTEAYYFYLHEKDTSKLQTRNRKLHTVGFRLLSSAGINAWDIEIESIFQAGTVRASANPTDRLDLDHQTFSQTVNLGYNFDTPSRLRAILEFNYASGDSDPNDEKNGRFDSLFGPTTFEFAPVALYNPFNRSNLITTGVRMTSSPWPNIGLMADYRHFWLAEKKDSWGRTGLRDVAGDSGRYLGQHLELRLRWSAAPGNIRIDSGLVFLDARNLSDVNSEFFYIGSKIDF